MSVVDGNPYLLRGEIVISKYSKTGYWTAGDIVVSDIQGNQRFEGRNDCVWNMYVNNPLEDLEAAKYVSGSLNYALSDTIVEGHKAQNLQVTFKVTDNIGLRDNQPVMIRLSRGENQYSWDDQYGSWNPETQIATIEFLITEYFPTADYHVELISIYDKAQTNTYVEFSDSPYHEPIKKIHIVTPNPDTQAPEIDLNRITVYAEPTNKEAPDGETLVTINYYARDDKSGLGTVGYYLKDPQGIMHREYHYHRNFHSLYFDGDPTVWERYTIKCILPKGSAPGIWGLAQMDLSDKAWNGKTYNFVETLIFEPDDSNTDYVLFSEMRENDMLSISLSSEVTSGYGFTYRVIHEESGMEIDGDVNPLETRSLYAPSTQVDVSSLPDGKLVVIALIKNETNEVAAVRSTTLTKQSTTNITQATINSKFSIYGSTGKIIIESDKEQLLYIHSIDGYLIKKIKTEEGTTIIDVPHGIYIIGGRKCIVK